MAVLVTGSSGFLGSHLVDFLLARGDNVLALQRRKATDTRDRLRIIQGDILDAVMLGSVMNEHRPTQVYHLAAQSFPHVSWQDPWETHQINVQGTLNVLDAARQSAHKPAIVVASSSAIYSQRPDGQPIQEEDPCIPASPYGVSKLAADHLSRLYAKRYDMRIVIARPFFFIGPRKTGDVISDWVRSVVEVERGKLAELSVGNTDVVRDFLHVNDGVAALARLAENGQPGEAYNIASGRGWNLADLLKSLIALARVPITARVDPAKFRPLDERVKVGDPAKLRALGWREQFSPSSGLEETIEFWRNQP